MCHVKGVFRGILAFHLDDLRIAPLASGSWRHRACLSFLWEMGKSVSRRVTFKVTVCVDGLKGPPQAAGASEDRVTPTVKNQSDHAAGSTGNSMKDDNGKKTKTSKPAKEENKNKAKKQDDQKDNEQDEKKTAAHRASSLLWRQKYVRKGALRNPEDDAKKMLAT